MSTLAVALLALTVLSLRARLLDGGRIGSKHFWPIPVGAALGLGIGGLLAAHAGNPLQPVLIGTVGGCALGVLAVLVSHRR